MAVKLKIFLVTEAASATDQKTTVLKIKGIQVRGDTTQYEIPTAIQNIKHHTKLMEDTAVKNACETMKVRHLYRQVNVKLSADAAKEYVDDSGNVKFGGDYLNIATVSFLPPQTSESVQAAEANASNRSGETQKKSLTSATKDMVVDKYSMRKNQNASVWITIFEEECQRAKIMQEQYSDALRLFLEGSESEWYSATRCLMGAADWPSWRKAFLDTFGNKGWIELAHAYNYVYIGGSYTEYAMKKLNLLVNADSNLTEKSRVGHIVVGFPAYMQSRLNRTEMVTFAKLMSELTQIEDGRNKQKAKMGKFSSFNSPNLSLNKPGFKGRQGLQDRKPCSICEKRGKPGMMHPEDKCYFRDRKLQDRLGNVKMANNTGLESLFNVEEDLKN